MSFNPFNGGNCGHTYTKAEIDIMMAGKADLDSVTNLIPTSEIPPEVFERMKVVENDTARFALTTSDVQNGDVVYVNADQIMYYVYDDTKLDQEIGYKAFASSIAAKAIADKNGNDITTTYVNKTDEYDAGKTVPSSTHAEIFNDYTNNQATNNYAHAEGSNTKAWGAYSHAEGYYTRAAHTCCHAEGQNTVASSPYAHAEGYACQAQGNSAHAEGDTTVANAAKSHSEGEGTKAMSTCQHVEGKYNVEDSNNKFAHIIGNGTYNTRSNAFAIDWSGKIYTNNAVTGVDVCADLQSKIDSTHKLSADLVDDSNSTNKFNVQANWTESSSAAASFIQNKPTLGTASALDVAITGDASTTQVVKGDDSRLTDSRTPTAHNQASDTINAMTGYSKAQADSAITTSDTLNAAIGKLEYKVDVNKTNILSEQAKTTGMTEGGSNYITVGGIRVYVSATAPTGDIPDGSVGVGW